MSDGGVQVMTYKFTGDVSGAAAAIQELKARLAELNREGGKYAREAAKGNTEARKGLLDAVKAADQYKNKIRDLTNEVQKFQKVQSQGSAAGGEARKLNGGLIGGAMNQLAFGLDDAIQQYGATGRLSDALRGAGNNATMLASAFGPMAVVGTAAAFAIGGAFARVAENEDHAKKKLEEYKKSLEEARKFEARGPGWTDKQEKVREQEKHVWEAEHKAKELLKVEEFRRKQFNNPKIAPLDETVKAQDDARVQRERLTQLQAENAAEERFSKGDKLKDLYETTRAKLGGAAKPGQVEAEVYNQAQNFARNPAERAGLKEAIRQVAKESEKEIAGKAIEREFRTPQEQVIEDQKDKIAKAELALHAKEQAAEANRIAEHRKHQPREVRDDIETARQNLQVMRDLLKTNELQLEEQKRLRLEVNVRTPQPQGLGNAPP